MTSLHVQRIFVPSHWIEFHRSHLVWAISISDRLWQRPNYIQCLPSFLDEQSAYIGLPATSVTSPVYRPSVPSAGTLRRDRNAPCSTKLERPRAERLG